MGEIKIFGNTLKAYVMYIVALCLSILGKGILLYFTVCYFWKDPPAIFSLRECYFIIGIVLISQSKLTIGDFEGI